MKIMKIILAALLVQGAIAAANCQPAYTGTLKGKVFDKATKQAVPGVTIVLRGTQTGAFTDTAGIFIIHNIPEGVYSVVVSFVGYQEKMINDIQVLRNKTGYREIEIEEAVTGLKEVTVTARRFEYTRLTPVSGYSFSREEIARNPGAQGDIFRAIGMLPGVSSSGGEYSAIAVRGQGTRDNLYMVDDIPVTEVGHLEAGNNGFNDPNGGRFSIFAPRVIDHAGFQGGGFNAQYGRKSASFLGLSIKEGNNEDLVVDGQLDLMGLTVNYDGPAYLLKNTSIFLSARYQNLTQVENLAGLKDLGTPKYQDFIFKSTSRIGKKNTLSVIAIYSPETFTRTTANIREDKKLNSLFVADVANAKTIAGISLRTLVGRNSYWKNLLYFTSTTEDNSFGLSYPRTDSTGSLVNGSDIPYESNIRNVRYSESKIGLRSMHSVRFANSSNLVAGVDLDRVDLHNNRQLSRPDTSYVFDANDFRPNPLQYFLVNDPAFFNVDVKKFSYNASAYLNYSFNLLKRLSLNAGLRYDYSGFTTQHTLSPRLNGSFQLNETSSITFGTGIFYQDPEYADIANQPAGKKLKAEKVVQVIAGFKKYFTPDVKFTVEGWYKKLDQLIVRPVAGRVEQNNAGDGYAYGVDVNLTKRLTSKVHGQIGYSWMQSRRNDHDGYGEYDFTFSQPHQVNFLVGYKPGKHWILSTKFRYATGKPTSRYIVHNNIFNNAAQVRYSEEITAVNTKRLPDFISLDIRADYRFQVKRLGLTAFVDIVDVLNRQNVNGESFNQILGTTYYDGISIFPSFGLKFQL